MHPFFPMPPLPPAARWIVSLFTVALLASCSPRETPVEKATRDNTLLLGNAAEPADLDPQLMTAYTDGNIHMALFEGLTALDEESLQAVPSSAERWETSADGLTWTFHLRPDLRWSNGEPVLASDFVASWRRLVSPALASDNAYLLYPVKHAAAISSGQTTDFSQLGIAAPDDRTVVVTLERPTPWFAQLTAAVPTFVLNPRTLAAFDATTRRGTDWTRPGNLVGSGPFTLADWRPQAHVTVRKNPHHWQAASVTLESIVFLPTDNPDVDERNFRAGQVHATQNLPIAKIADWRQRAPAQLRIDPLTQSNFLRFNTARPPLNDARIRRALSLAIDRDTFARTLLQSTRAPAFALTPPKLAGYTPAARVATDFDAARKLLADAGHPDGRDLPVFELQCRNDEIHPRYAEAIQATWQRELGIRVTLAPSEQKTWLENQQSGNYTITFGAWLADFPDASNFLGLFTSTSGYNWTGWHDADYDRLLAEATPLADTARRHALYQQAESRLLDSAPIAPLYYGASTYLLHPAVQGWPPASLGWRRYQLVHLDN